MKSAFSKSVNIVAPYWPWIIFLGVLGVFGSNRFWPEFSIPVFLGVFVGTIYLYGRVACDLLKKPTEKAAQILHENWVNYLVVTLLLGVPQVAFRVVFAGWLDSWFLYVLFSTVLGSALSGLTIYVLPIVFLKKSSLGAVLAGVVFLGQNLSDSRWIIGIVVVANVLATAGSMLFKLEATPWSFVLALFAGLLGFYGAYVAFAGALQVLIEGGEKRSGLHA
jgi:hypothetical protein